MSREQWCKLYAARRREAYKDCFEDVRLFGVSVKYLRNLIYDVSSNTWYKLSLAGQLDRNMITTYINEASLTIHDLLEDNLDDSCPRTFDKTSHLSCRDSHAAVAKKHNGKWYMLDSAEEGPLCITDDDHLGQ